MKTLRFALIAMLVLCSVTLVLGQPARPVRPGPGQGAGPRPPGGPMGGFGAPGGFGVQVLKTRKLENKPLDEKEQKKYDNMISSMGKHATGARSGAGNPAQDAMGQFRLASTQLRYGQEKDAAEALGKAWENLVGLMKDAKTAAAGIGQARGHLRELQTLAPKDPELVLSLMSELGEKHTAVYDAVENPRIKPQLANPIATVWAVLMQMGQLDKDALAKGAKWVLMFPQMAMADRPLPENQQGEYQAQLAQVNIGVNAKIRQLAERQVLAARGNRPANAPLPPPPPPGVNLGENASETADPLTLQAISLLEPKRGAIMRFMEADIHFRWGQFHDGAAATASGWKELLEVYRGNAHLVSPLDTQVHAETIDQLATRNPVQTLILLSQLDPMYRGMAQVDPFFATRVADQWMKLAPNLPLNAALLEQATFWVVNSSKLGKEQEAKYGPAIDGLKKQLADARKAEGIAEKDGEDDDKHEAGEKGEKENDDKPGHREKEGEEKNERRVGGRKLPLPPNLNKREQPEK